MAEAASGGGSRPHGSSSVTQEMPRKLTLGEPTGPYPELAYLMREIVNGMSLRQAANRTGRRISHDAIRRAMTGERIAAEKLEAFALAFNRNPNELLKAAGWGLRAAYPMPGNEQAPGQKLRMITPEGFVITVESADGDPIELPREALRRIDLDILLSREEKVTQRN